MAIVVRMPAANAPLKTWVPTACGVVATVLGLWSVISGDGWSKVWGAVAVVAGLLMVWLGRAQMPRRRR